jgi:hypothetical protein
MPATSLTTQAGKCAPLARDMCASIIRITGTGRSSPPAGDISVNTWKMSNCWQECAPFEGQEREYQSKAELTHKSAPPARDMSASITTVIAGKSAPLAIEREQQHTLELLERMRGKCERYEFHDLDQ